MKTCLDRGRHLLSGPNALQEVVDFILREVASRRTRIGADLGRREAEVSDHICKRRVEVGHEEDEADEGGQGRVSSAHGPLFRTPRRPLRGVNLGGTFALAKGISTFQTRFALERDAAAAARGTYAVPALTEEATASCRAQACRLQT